MAGMGGKLRKERPRMRFIISVEQRLVPRDEPLGKIIRRLVGSGKFKVDDFTRAMSKALERREKAKNNE